MDKFTLEGSGAMDGTKDLAKNGRVVPCYIISPIISNEGIIRLPCNSKCLHFNLVTDEKDGVVKVFAQFTCGGIGVKKEIENASAEPATPVSPLIKV